MEQQWYAERTPLGAPATRADGGTGRQPMYLMHKYWARKPWYYVKQCIERYTRPGDLVLDPFCGSGVTVCEALAAGRRAIGNDLNPAAVLLTRLTAAGPFDVAAFDAVVERVRARVQAAIGELYRLDEYCPTCGALLQTDWVGRGAKWFTVPNGPLAMTLCPHGCRDGARQRPLTATEWGRLVTVEAGDEAQAARDWLGRFPLYYGDGHRFDKKRRQESLADLFSSRNAVALRRLRDAIKAEAGPPPASCGSDAQQASGETLANQLVWLAFSSASHLCSSFRAPRTGHWAVNGLYVPPDWVDENAWAIFSQRLARVRQGKLQSSQRIDAAAPVDWRVRRGSATDLGDIADASVDYIFTDPPYGDSIQYFELSYLWNSLLEQETSATGEIIINRSQGKDLSAYQALLTAAFREAYRVLKPGRWLTVTFANRDSRVWDSLLAACAAAGFELVSIASLSPISQAYNQIWAGPAPKTDLVIDFWRPSVEVRRGAAPTPARDLKATVHQVAADLINERGSALTSEVCEGVVVAWIASRYGTSRPQPEFTSDDIARLLAQEFARAGGETRDNRWTVR